MATWVISGGDYGPESIQKVIIRTIKERWDQFKELKLIENSFYVAVKTFHYVVIKGVFPYKTAQIVEEWVFSLWEMLKLAVKASHHWSLNLRSTVVLRNLITYLASWSSMRLWLNNCWFLNWLLNWLDGFLNYNFLNHLLCHNLFYTFNLAGRHLILLKLLLLLLLLLQSLLLLHLLFLGLYIE
jgi:hypothetical protein